MKTIKLADVKTERMNGLEIPITYDVRDIGISSVIGFPLARQTRSLACLDRDSRRVLVFGENDLTILESGDRKQPETNKFGFGNCNNIFDMYFTTKKGTVKFTELGLCDDLQEAGCLNVDGCDLVGSFETCNKWGVEMRKLMYDEVVAIAKNIGKFERERRTAVEIANLEMQEEELREKLKNVVVRKHKLIEENQMGVRTK